MIYQDSDLAPCSRLYELLEQLEKHDEERKRSLEVEKILRGHREMQKSFACMLRIKAPVTLQEQWVNEDRARFNAWLDEENFPYVSDYRSIPFEKWLGPKAGGQFFAPATIKIRPQNIVETAEEKSRPSIFSIETECSVGLEEKDQVFESKIDLENYSSEECSNDEQGRDIGLVEKITPIDMIIGDKADMEKSRSAKLFMLGEHKNFSTHLAADNKFFLTKLKMFEENLLFGLEQSPFGKFDIHRYRFGIKHRWPPSSHGSATFIPAEAQGNWGAMFGPDFTPSGQAIEAVERASS